MKEPFLQPRLHGARYAEGSVPLDVLAEWTAVEVAILELARYLYLQDHVDRKRVPRGFAEAFTLHLSGIAAGSAIPQIDRVVADDQDAREYARYFVRARDLLLAAIMAAHVNSALPSEVPPGCLSRLERFGRSLRPDERIEFLTPEQPGQSVAVLDRDAHKRLALWSGKHEYQAEVELRGQVSGFDGDRATFTFTQLDGTRLQGVWTQETKGTVFEALSRYVHEQQRVRLLAFAAYDSADRPVRLDEVLVIEPLDPLDVPARLAEFKALREGWLNGSGAPLPGDGLKWLETAWLNHYPVSLANPFTYPTSAGGVQFEWSFGRWELSAEIDLEHRTAWCSAADVQGDAMEERSVSLATPDGWNTLVAFIRQYEPSRSV